MSGYEFTRIKRESVIRQSAEQIFKYIEGRQLVPGASLPSEVALSSMLGISRNSLREAIRILDGLGFIEKRPGKGLFVKVVFGGAANLEAQGGALAKAAAAALQVRTVIESECAELAASTATESDLKRVESALATFEEALARGDLVVALQGHAEFHDAIVNAARNPILASIYREVRFLLPEMANLGAKFLYKNPKHRRTHRDIYKALRSRDPRCAAAAVRHHFKTVAPLVEFLSENRSKIDTISLSPSKCGERVASREAQRMSGRRARQSAQKHLRYEP